MENNHDNCLSKNMCSVCSVRYSVSSTLMYVVIIRYWPFIPTFVYIILHFVLKAVFESHAILVIFLYLSLIKKKSTNVKFWIKLHIYFPWKFSLECIILNSHRPVIIVNWLTSVIYLLLTLNSLLKGSFLKTKKQKETVKTQTNRLWILSSKYLFQKA